jgi:MFS-type transporter involved in bile tolerance (Atg22 family)
VTAPANSASRTGRLVVFLLLGLVLGGFLGELLALSAAHLGEISGAGRENVVYLLLARFWAVDFGFGMPPSTDFVLDLFILKIRLGFAFKMNIGCLPGVILALYLEKWSR